MNNRFPALVVIPTGTALASACTDLKPIQAQVAELRSSVSK